jgi:carbon-monoxide dehydrogenase large subunit
MLWLGIVRSPHAHARIAKIDGREASRLPGVVAVLTREDMPELDGSVPPLVPAPSFPSSHHPVLAAAAVKHVGEAVAVVAAETPYLAADALERVVIEYEPLPAVASPEAALAPGAPKVHDDWPDNLAGISETQTGDARSGFARAEITVEMRLHYPRVGGMPIEPRGVLASLDAVTGLLTVWCSTQVPFGVRSGIAAVLGMAEEHVRVIAPDVGGGFGIKGHVYPEDILIPAVARRLGRPVKWIETRREHFLSAAADRDQEHQARLGLSRDGAIVALETDFTRDHGAHTPLGEAIAYNTMNHLVGPYRVPHFKGVGRNVVTHKTFLAAYRGAGRPEANFVLDRLLDRGARAVGMDPADLRRKNLIRMEEMPWRTGLVYRDGVPIAYDPADYVKMFDLALESLGYARWRAEQAERRGSSRPLGLGVSAYMEGTGIGPFEGANVRVDPNGTVFVDIGVSSQGQAHETTLAQLAAEELGVSIEQVVIRGGDTQLLGYGMGTIASRVAAVAGPAIARAARETAKKAKVVAASLFECAPEDVVLEGGRVIVAGVPSKSVPLATVAKAAVRNLALADHGGPGLNACAFHYPGTVAWAFGVHAVALEVDVETCALRLLKYVAAHDCGRPINPMIVEGQIHGGLAQGIGTAMGEELIYDDAGQLLTGTFMDYPIPRADDMPPLEIHHLDFPSPINELGIKGVGESGIVSPAGVIAGAVEDALWDRGVRVTRVPVTSARIFELLRAASRS